ncbi:MAG: hypothetical protein A3K19_29160 [Lentisphaerae bacterium RIFOXYB12_FULL_65_16]|nr:MAG: hypothetical protein A3K18_04550 [Lentisphaerae bacterium RIFOXYA12_64_32]OGV88368.1 MAG: hypothetical protein A3K19_29160 [Lentisphaerae bacterium RIFOXYB12_FULL_65_16]
MTFSSLYVIADLMPLFPGDRPPPPLPWVPPVAIVEPPDPSETVLVLNQKQETSMQADSPTKETFAAERDQARSAAEQVKQGDTLLWQGDPATRAAFQGDEKLFRSYMTGVRSHAR